MQALAGMASRKETTGTLDFCLRAMEVPVPRLRGYGRGRVGPGTKRAEPSAAEPFPRGATHSGPELGTEVRAFSDACATQPAKSEVAGGGGDAVAVPRRNWGQFLETPGRARLPADTG